MIKFKIKPFNGHNINAYGQYCVKFFAVFAFNFSANDWIFIKSFYSEQRAFNFIHDLKKQIAKGDFSCLTLKT